jgi:hypothetical protein
MASQETVAENLLLLQLDFLRRALGVPSGQQPAGPAEGVLLSPPREISQLRN